MERKNAPFLPDPVTGSLIGLCPIIVVTGNFGAGVMMAVGVLVSMLVLGATLPTLRSLFPERLRAPVAFALAASLSAGYALAAEAYSPSLASLVGIFIPLTIVNCLVLTTLRRGIRGDEPFSAWLLPSSFIYFGVIVAISALREAIGLGRLTLPVPGEVPMTLVFFDAPPLRLLAAPAGGFVLLGCLAGLYRIVLRKGGRRIP